MPQLGLGLGLDKSSQLKSLAQLVKSAGGVLYLDARKADGVQKGVNSPFTNPLIDLTKLGNNATLTNFAATQTDGYTLEATVNSNGQAVDYSNLVVNGDFANGTTGWLSPSGTQAVVGGINEYTITSTSGSARVERNVDDAVSGARYYLVGEILPLFSNTTYLQYGGTAITSVTPTANVWSKISGIVTAIDSTRLRFYHSTAAGYTIGQIVKRDNIQAIRLDDNPQIQTLETALGRQLTVAECDRIFPFVATTGVTYVSARPYIATDGLDSYGVLNWNVPNIGSSEDFEVAWIGLTPTTLSGGYVFASNSGTSTLPLAFGTATNGQLITFVNDIAPGSTSAGTIKENSIVDYRLKRKNGTISLTLNGVVIYSNPNNQPVNWGLFARLFARTSNAGGTTHTAFSKIILAYIVLAIGTNVDKLDGVLDKVSRDYR